MRLSIWSPVESPIIKGRDAPVRWLQRRSPAPIAPGGVENATARPSKETQRRLNRTARRGRSQCRSALEPHQGPAQTCGADTLYYEYTDFGALSAEYQEHEGKKDASTLYVGYNYAEDNDTYNGISDVYTKALRLKSVRYPNARLVHRVYSDSAFDDDISRVTSLNNDNSGSAGATAYAAYSYNGVGRLAVEDFTQPGLRLDYWGQTPDEYAGLDHLGRVKQQLWRFYGGSPADRVNQLYVYDRNSNRTHKDNTLTAGLDEAYTHDKHDRLTDMDRGTLSGSWPTYSGGMTDKVRNEAWTLTPTGNWSEYKVDADSGAADGDYVDAGDLNQTREHNDVNEVEDTDSDNDAIGETAGQVVWADPVQSARGNMTEAPTPADMTKTYTCIYDAWNRLVEVQTDDDPAKTIAKYEYDGVGRRIKKHIDSAAPASPDDELDVFRHFYYNAAWQILETREAAADATQPETLKAEYQYVWSLRYIDAPVLRDENVDNDDDATEANDDERLYYLTDVNMNVVAVANTSGAVVERYAYDPYGGLTVLHGAADKDGAVTEWAVDTGGSDVANSIGFCGYYRDGETGLSHVRNRMYHPLLGRWLQRDPLGYVDGMGLYEYCRGGPTVWLDAWGLEGEKADRIPGRYVPGAGFIPDSDVKDDGPSLVAPVDRGILGDLENWWYWTTVDIDYFFNGPRNVDLRDDSLTRRAYHNIAKPLGQGVGNGAVRLGETIVHADEIPGAIAKLCQLAYGAATDKTVRKVLYMALEQEYAEFQAMSPDQQSDFVVALAGEAFFDAAATVAILRAVEKIKQGLKASKAAEKAARMLRALHCDEAGSLGRHIKKITVTKRGLAHTVARHMPGGARTAGKSLFGAGESVSALAQAAESVTPVIQRGGNLARIMNAGRVIGVDRATGKATRIYTVITNAVGELVTMFPGTP